ncbi:MAG: hypothetical protein HYR49_00005 [Gammaproteobacteria bacterium]|nr:hypothetical protein [Gammaproteobacteria bacterium]
MLIRASLYLDPEVASTLKHAAPVPQDGGLDHYCLALEGVSHFLYLVWYASRFIREGSRVALLRELRDFYRLSRGEKLHHISRLNGALAGY